jgi:hypothetical protein
MMQALVAFIMCGPGAGGSSYVRMQSHRMPLRPVRPRDVRRLLRRWRRNAACYAFRGKRPGGNHTVTIGVAARNFIFRATVVPKGCVAWSRPEGIPKAAQISSIADRRAIRLARRSSSASLCATSEAQRRFFLSQAGYAANTSHTGHTAVDGSVKAIAIPQSGTSTGRRA